MRCVGDRRGDQSHGTIDLRRYQDRCLAARLLQSHPAPVEAQVFLCSPSTYAIRYQEDMSRLYRRRGWSISHQ